MLATAFIVLRERLEAALIVSIGLATSVGIPHRDRWVRLIGVTPRRTTALVIVVAGAALATRPAHADLHVFMPEVEFHEFEFEHNGLFTFDKKDSPLNGLQSYTNAIGYGVTPFWGVELEIESNTVPGSSVHYAATTMENTFQLTEPGKYAINLGLFVEISKSALRDVPSSGTFGPIIQKELNNVAGVDSLHTVDLFFSHDIGHGAGHETGFQLAWQSRLEVMPAINPAVETYWLIPDIRNPGRFNTQQFFVGPVLVGSWNFAPYGKLGYEAGYLFGATSATPRGAVRWKLEYEIAF
jgi:hypothetical protein